MQLAAHLAQEFAVAGFEGKEVGLQVIADKLAGVLDEFHMLDVQLVRHQILIDLAKVRAADVQVGQGLTHLNVAQVAAGAAQHHHVLHGGHLALNVGVDHAFVAHRIIAQMHALGSVLVHGAHDVLIDILGHEGHEGRDQEGQGGQHGVQGDEGGFLVALHALAPEAVTAQAHIPVGQVVHKVGQLAAGLGDAVIAQIVVHALDQGVQAAQHPLVHQAQLGLIDIVLGGIELVDIGIEHVEVIGVPQGAHEFALIFRHVFLAEPAGQPGSAGGVEVPAHGVRALIIQHVPGIHHVAQVLAHLAAVGVLHVAQHQAVLEGALAKQLGGDGQQGIEPAAGLVDGFADEVGGETLLELFFVLKGIMPLGEGHGAAVVPAVDDFLGAVHGLAAMGAPEDHFVDVGTMQLRQIHFADGHIQQLLLAADNVHMAFFAQPDGQRGAPIALTAQAPVHHVLQEVAHTAFLDVVGHPVDGAVVGHQVVPHGGHLDEPGGTGIIEQRRIAAPAEGIIMGEGHGGEQQAAGFQIGQNHRIGVLHKGAGPGGALHKFALGVHQVDKGHVVGLAHAVVVLAVGRGDMHDAGAVLHGHVVVADHEPGLLVGLHKAIEGLVFHAAQVVADHLGHDLGLLALQYLFHQGLGHDIGAALVRLNAAIGLMGIDAQGQVAGQGPGGGGPGQQIGVFLALYLKADEGGLFFYVLIALGHLVAGQGGAAAGAVGDDLVALVDHTLFGDLLQAPPHGFDVVIVIGDIGMLHIHPEAHALGHVLPQMQVLPYAFLAFLDEGLDAVLLDLGLAVQAQLLFHFQLHRQAVGIPARDAQHVFALHGLIAGDQILDGAGQHVADVGLAVGGRRAVKEGEVLPPIPQMEALFLDAVLLPEGQHFLFAGGEVHVSRHFFVHSSCSFQQMKRPVRPLGTDRPRYHPN